MGLGDGKAFFGICHHLGPFFISVGVTKLPTRWVILSPLQLATLNKEFNPLNKIFWLKFLFKGPRDKFKAIDTLCGSLAQFFKLFLGPKHEKCKLKKNAFS
jgi:hypothetical protein